MKKTITRKLLLWLAVALLLSGGVFAGLMAYIQDVTDQAAEELGALYMSEMMFQMQDHLESVVDMKIQALGHVAQHAQRAGGERASIREEAEQLGFEYLALYDESGRDETILGEAAWYRGVNLFIERVLLGEKAATTGYLTHAGGKYVVFGVPAVHEMESGRRSVVMLAGFSVEKLYDYIDLDAESQLSSNAEVRIILTNGSYVLGREAGDSTSFFDHIAGFGEFTGTDVETGVARIERAMANGRSFSCMATIGGEPQHIYGAPTKEPGDWYFVLSMPKGAPDAAVAFQSVSIVRAFVLACVIILLLFSIVFLLYLRLSMQQLTLTEQARAEAEKASRAKSTFLFNASHDIRTPMNAIQGFARIIAKHPEDSVLVRETIEKIDQAGTTLMQLLGEVLELSRIESGKVELNPAPLDLARQMEHMKSMFLQEMQDVGLDFEVKAALTDGVVLCDGLKLTQILMNLLSNAKKFTPAGGRVTCGVEQLAGEAAFGEYLFYVEDTGIGMSEEFRERAFEQFERERTSTLSGVQGSGLGLSIIKRLVERMEGACTLHSKLGEGTRVEVKLRLPLTQMPAEADKTEDIPDRDLHGLRVLLVEDNDFNREITRYILEAQGMQVEEASDGAVALDLLGAATEPFDLILMDIQMPVMDGFTAAEHIRAMEDPALRELPIIAITANAFTEDVERCLRAGMNAHVSKPVDPDHLRLAIAKLVRKREE